MIKTLMRAQFTMWGLVLTLFGTLLAAMKTVLTNTIQVRIFLSLRRERTWTVSTGRTTEAASSRSIATHVASSLRTMRFVRVVYGRAGSSEGVRSDGDDEGEGFGFARQWLLGFLAQCACRRAFYVE